MKMNHVLTIVSFPLFIFYSIVFIQAIVHEEYFVNVLGTFLISLDCLSVFSLFLTLCEWGCHVAFGPLIALTDGFIKKADETNRGRLSPASQNHTELSFCLSFVRSFSFINWIVICLKWCKRCLSQIWPPELALNSSYAPESRNKLIRLKTFTVG